MDGWMLRNGDLVSGMRGRVDDVLDVLIVWAGEDGGGGRDAR